MKFLPAFDIWQVPVELLAKAQAGQWVYAGDKSNKGQFYGVKPSGTVVVAWEGNAKNAQSYREYKTALLNYAKGSRPAKKACKVQKTSVQLALF